MQILQIAWFRPDTAGRFCQAVSALVAFTKIHLLQLPSQAVQAKK